MKTRNQLHRSFIQSRDTVNWINYKDSRNKVKKTLRDAERNHTTDEVQQHKHNPSSLWKIIKRTIPSKEQEGHVYAKDPQTVADEFNQFFSSVGRHAANASARLAEVNNIAFQESSPGSAVLPLYELFSFRSVTCEDVRLVISSLPLNKSLDRDKIDARILKDAFLSSWDPLQR